MARPEFFTFDAEGPDLDQAFEDALADPGRHAGLVRDAIDSMQGLSQPWASRMTRLLLVMQFGYEPAPVPDIRKKDRT